MNVGEPQRVIEVSHCTNQCLVNQKQLNQRRNRSMSQKRSRLNHDGCIEPMVYSAVQYTKPLVVAEAMYNSD
jgi:hypothetical protein